MDKIIEVNPEEKQNHFNLYEVTLIRKSVEHYLRFVESFGDSYIEYWEEEAQDLTEILKKLHYALEMEVTKRDSTKELIEAFDEDLPF